MRDISRFITVDHDPPETNGVLLAVFTGSCDNAQSATAALRYIMQKSESSKFAEIDPDPFFSFDGKWPWAGPDQEGNPMVHWPSIRLHHSGDGRTPGPMFLTGHRPSMRMLTLVSIMESIVDRYGLHTIIQLASLRGNVPHTRPAPLGGMATAGSLMKRLELPSPQEAGSQVGVDPIHLEVCLRKEIGYASLAGYVPQYIMASPYYSTSLAIIRRISQGLELQVDTGDMEEEHVDQQKNIQNIMENNPSFHQMVSELEAQQDQGISPMGNPYGNAPGGPPAGSQEDQPNPLADIDASSMGEEVERFLREQGHGPPGSPPE